MNDLLKIALEKINSAVLNIAAKKSILATIDLESAAESIRQLIRETPEALFQQDVINAIDSIFDTYSGNIGDVNNLPIDSPILALKNIDLGIPTIPDGSTSIVDENILEPQREVPPELQEIISDGRGNIPVIEASSPEDVVFSNDYDRQVLLLSEDIINKINFEQTPNEKQALIDDDEDILDTLNINEDGFVVVPAERRRLILSSDPQKFSELQEPRYVDPGLPTDSTNITVKNKGFSLRVTKVFENESEIKFNIVVENTDSNCLVIDRISYVAGSDYSTVSQETNISENEKILRGTPDANGITTNKKVVEEFIQTYYPNYDTIDSQLNSPFDIIIPPHLVQSDNRSVVLCPKNSTSNKNRPNNIDNEVLPSGMTRLQIELIKEARARIGFYEKVSKTTAGDYTGNNYPATRLIKVNNNYEAIADKKLVDEMSRIAGWSRGTAWCAAFSHTCLYFAAAGLSDPILNEITNRGNKLNNSTVSSANYASNKGLLIKKLVPGTVAYFKRKSQPAFGHTVVIVDVRKVLNGGNTQYDLVTIEGNTSGESGAPGTYDGASQQKGGDSTKGRTIRVDRGGNLVFGSGKYEYSFLGCLVPKSVQAAFPTGNYESLYQEVQYG